MKPLFDPERAFRTFNRHEVRYVVIGGYAAGLIGAPLVTNDVDICYDRSPGNLESLAQALVELGAKVRVAGVEEDLPFILDARTLAAGDSFTFSSEAGDIDVLGTPSGSGGYQDLDRSASNFDLGEGLVVRVVSLGDLMRMKAAAGRPKDLFHLSVLEAVRDEITKQEDPGSR
ncbi:MAG: hypothetical protein AB1673_01435 [Actinomycetota bacterium]